MRNKQVKLTTKLLKKMIRQELRESKNPLGKPDAYMARQIAPTENPDLEKWSEEDKEEAVKDVALLMQTFSDDYEDDSFSSFETFKGEMSRELDEENEEKLKEIYGLAKDYALKYNWLEKGTFKEV